MGNIVELTDGTRMDIKINFATMYHLQKSGGANLAKRLDHKKKNKKKITDDESMEFAAKVVYAVLRSNGRKVDFEEALELMYPDTSSIQAVLDAYEKELERYKKKEESKRKMRTMASR